MTERHGISSCSKLRIPSLLQTWVQGALLTLMLVPWSVGLTGETDGVKNSVGDLIDQLTGVDEYGMGYSAFMSGTQFLPRYDSLKNGTMLFGEGSIHDSDVMKALVSKGAKAIPALVAHLGDGRPTKLRPVSGLLWTAWKNEYDYNRRTRNRAPRGVNRDEFNHGRHLKEYQICVGDLCFVALGQIVNRNFSAVRHQPTGGTVVGSPVTSKILRNVIIKDFGRMTEDEHRNQLIDDLQQPDSNRRRNGAIMRLAYYYPDVLEELVLRQLDVPAYDIFAVRKYIDTELYPESNVETRRRRFHSFLNNHGQAASDGILLDLFMRLGSQIAAEEGRLLPAPDHVDDARSLLIQLYGYPSNVKPEDAPDVTSWSESERLGFVKSLGSVSSPRIRQKLTEMGLKG